MSFFNIKISLCLFISFFVGCLIGPVIFDKLNGYKTEQKQVTTPQPIIEQKQVLPVEQTNFKLTKCDTAIIIKHGEKSMLVNQYYDEVKK